MVLLRISLGHSAYGNVAQLHQNRKHQKVKAEKTIQQSEKVVKLA